MGRRNKRAHTPRSAAGPSRRPPQVNNMYGSLAETERDDGELNAHLSERLAGTSSRGFMPDDNVPAAPFLMRKDISEYFKVAKKPVAGGDWLEKPEIPGISEILHEKRGFSIGENLIEVEDGIRGHKVQGAYKDTEDYLRTKYELLREDAIRPIREAIEEVRESPFKDEADYQKSVGIYDPVYITSLVFSTRGLATRVAFSLKRVKKHIRWEQSRRLITGTLVALSPVDDAFQTICVLATVAARPLSALEQNPPEIDIFMRPEDQEIDPMRKWIMVECRSSFFEASRHTLLALQHLKREPFPLSKHLVYVQKEVEPPAYIKDNPYINLSSLVSMEESVDFENVNVLEEWPAASSHSLDESQSRALKRMLTKKLAIVQGPPGTGKTHVSVAALQILKDNLRRDDAPIIVTAQTNHAVDQILRHTKQFEPNYIRLGGRSKDKDIKMRTLFEIRSVIRTQPGFKNPKVQARFDLRGLTTTLQKVLEPLEANKSPLDHRVLLTLKLITEEQARSLELDSAGTIGMSSTSEPELLMEQWLGRCLVPCTRPIQPDDYGLGFEEEEDFDVEVLRELEAEAVQDDDDLDALRGPVVLLSDNYKGRGASLLTTVEIKEMLETTDDLTTIPASDRGAIYNFFMREMKKLLLEKFRRLAKQYETTVLSRKVSQWNEDLVHLNKARIIGCTTTGLSKYRALISAVRPRVILVEEAAETQEAPITAACLPTLEHLILVGDHLQLRPHTQVHAFENEPYYLNLSLFERLVNNEVEFNTLSRQRRMIPAIRQLLVPIYGTTLEDHESVKDTSNRPPVEGMGDTNVYWFTHQWSESRDANMSTLNETEGEMIVKFVEYLCLNGADPIRITILTFYNGQRKLLLRKLRQNPNLREAPIHVVTTDSYQGEENDIVLLSLVRSNGKGNIGFLESENRACVALSRAKRGFYIFGNGQLLACESGIWAAVIKIMYGKQPKARRRIGYNMPLVCTRHNNKLWIPEPGDFDQISGGCDLKCDGQLPCGHQCPHRCHPFDHERINCMQKCSRRVEECGHACVAECCDPCKCQTCERRTNGVKALLKSTRKGTTSSRTPGGIERNLSLEARAQVLSKSMLAPAQLMPAPSSPLQDRTPEWTSYANGGVQADDDRFYQKRREEEMKFVESIRNSTPPAGPTSTPAKLVEVSPKKEKAKSANMDLLIDIDMVTDGKTSRRQRNKEAFSYADAASSSKKKEIGPPTNLLD